MKSLEMIICVIAYLPLFSQTMQGTLHYSTVSLYSGFVESPDEIGLPGDSTRSTFSIGFNSNYTRRTEKVGSQTNVTVFNKATNDIYVALRNDEENFIRYYQSKEVPETNPGGNKKNEQYNDNFYIHLLNHPLPDTIVIRTEETKIIAGYPCRKTVLKLPDGDLIQVWSTDSLPGLEEYGQISDKVKGTTVMSEMISKMFYSRMQLISIDLADKIDEKQLIPFPDGLLLDLGTVLIDDDKLVEMNVMGYELPYFIDHPDFKITLNKMKDILDKSKIPASFADTSGTFDFLRFDIEVNKKGKISKIKLSTYSGDPDTRTKTALDELKRNCTFKHVSIYDKVVPFQFHVYYYFP